MNDCELERQNAELPPCLLGRAMRSGWLSSFRRGLLVVLYVVTTLTIAGGSMADEAPSESEKTSSLKFSKLTAGEFDELVQSFAKSEKIIATLTAGVKGGELVYSGTAEDNVQKSPWIILVGMTKEEFEQKSEDLKKQGFTLRAHETTSLRRSMYHSAVWVQQEQPAIDLKIPAGDLPVLGDLGRDIAPVNELMAEVLTRNNLPGATVAISVKGRLVYERGFGYCDVDTSKPMKPDTVMRIASVSKPLTAVAILLLIQDGKLSLDDPVLPLLEKHEQKFDAQTAISADARWAQITVRHLLNHSGGFDRDKSRDTMFQIVEITRELDLKEPAGITDIVRYQMQRPLDFDPGQKFVYSNVGYCLLGRIIESVSGVPYATFVEQRILAPAGMKQTRPGRTLRSELAPDEAHYFRQKRKRYPLVFDVVRDRLEGKIELVEASYGLWDVTVMDAHGGWTSTAADLLRFIAALEKQEGALLTPPMLALMKEPPVLREKSDEPVWYGAGWSVRDLGDGRFNYWHTGLLDGTSTELVHRWDDISWCVLFNCDRNPDDKRSSELIDSAMHQAIGRAIAEGLIRRED